MQLKRLLKSKFFVGITNKQRKYIIHPDFMVANQACVNGDANVKLESNIHLPQTLVQ